MEAPEKIESAPPPPFNNEESLEALLLDAVAAFGTITNSGWLGRKNEATVKDFFGRWEAYLKARAAAK